MSDDLYEGDESSGLLTHYIGRVKHGLWSTFFAETEGKATSDYAHNYLLFWHTEVLDILQGNFEQSGTPLESLTASLGIGNGWRPKPGEEYLIEHEDDTDTFTKKFHMNTNFMRFVYILSGQATEYEGAVALDGDGEKVEYNLRGVAAIHAKKGVKTLRDARIWENMIFEFRGLGTPTRQNPRPNARPLPTAFLGYDDSGAVDLGALGHTRTNEPVGASSPGSGGVPATVTEAWTAAGAEPGTVSSLSSLWTRAGSPDEFVGNAKLIPAVQNSEALQAVVQETAAGLA